MTPRAATDETHSDANEVVQAMNGLQRTIKNYALAFLAALGLGGGGAIIAIPQRLSKVEADHTRMLRHIGRVESASEYILCVVGERADTVRGDVRRCDSLRPRPARPDDEEIGG